MRENQRSHQSSKENVDPPMPLDDDEKVALQKATAPLMEFFAAVRVFSLFPLLLLWKKSGDDAVDL